MNTIARLKIFAHITAKGNNMENKIDQIGKNIYHILSQPGDGTRYDYFCYHNFDEFCFMPRNSTFRFPQRLNYYVVKKLTEEELIKLAAKENCNPWTLKECIRTILKILGDKDGE